MRRVFIDTSALYAVVVATDAHHERAASAFDRLAAEEAVLLTTSYVLVETYALIGRRIGLEAVAAFRSEFMPLLDVIWVDAALHERGLDVLLRTALPALSLVDAVSFEVVREQRLDAVFAFDRHFTDAGLPLL